MQGMTTPGLDKVRTLTHFLDPFSYKVADHIDHLKKQMKRANTFFIQINSRVLYNIQ